MGLDIRTARGPLEKIAESMSALSDDEFERLWEEGHYPFSARSEFPWTIPPLEEGVVYRSAGEGTGFRAGSYSGYNQWREELARFAFNCEPEVVWKDPKKYAGKPFFELVHFSDCEGIIAETTAAKLYEDFRQFYEGARKAWNEPADWQVRDAEGEAKDWRLELYELFMLAFREAAETRGAVIFT